MVSRQSLVKYTQNTTKSSIVTRVITTNIKNTNDLNTKEIAKKCDYSELAFLFLLTFPFLANIDSKHDIRARVLEGFITSRVSSKLF